MKSKTKELLNIIKSAKYHKAYKYFIKNNYTKHNVEWYAEDWARSFVSLPCEEARNFPERKEVYY